MPPGCGARPRELEIMLRLAATMKMSKYCLHNSLNSWLSVPVSLPGASSWDTSSSMILRSPDAAIAHVCARHTTPSIRPPPPRYM
eukprot:2390309-Prorocentrum_lima.AAC.1